VPNCSPISLPASTPSSALRSHSNHIYDEELIDGRDGHDIASFLDHSIRYARAAYAIVHLIIDKGRP
jgi:hypothetical protein